VGEAPKSRDSLFSKPGFVSIAILAGVIDDVMCDGSAPRFIFRPNFEIGYCAIKGLAHSRQGMRGE
jgi:hypothetical protein